MFAAFSICLAHNDTSPLTPKVLSDATYSWSHYVACALELPACTLTIKWCFRGPSYSEYNHSVTNPVPILQFTNAQVLSITRSTKVKLLMHTTYCRYRCRYDACMQKQTRNE